MLKFLIGVRERLASSSFASSLAILSGGSAIGAVIALMASPFIARLYSPREFGALGVYATTLLIVSVVAALRYDLAIPSAVDDREAAGILLTALSAVVVTSSVCAALVGLGAGDLVGSIREALPGSLRWWIPAGMLMAGSYTVLAAWMIRRRDFATLGRTKVTQSLLMTGTQALLGLLRVGPSGLILGQVAGSSAGLLRLRHRIVSTDISAFQGHDAREIARHAHRFRRFPLLSAPAVLLDAVTAALPLLFFAAHFGGEAAGIMTLVQRVLVAPLALLTTNMGQIVFADLAHLRREDPGAMMGQVRRRLRVIAVTGVVLLAGMAIVVPWALPPLFGARWARAVSYFLLMLPLLLANFVSAPFGFVIDVLRRQDLHMIREVLRVLVMCTALATILLTHADWQPALAWISGAGVINGIIYLGASFVALRHPVEFDASAGDDLLAATGA